ncbi:hypothetical protein H0H81_010683 [Sphagnurus paluster]|uniref:Uncharacterized protein n=1 Tax=Sphagnurus paluster TaxID=117069 RepID=A0A9P7FVI5_9AGAR|nr:hypothetical protein H0H81_010683 [Sphagnurus paluster]
MRMWRWWLRREIGKKLGVGVGVGGAQRKVEPVPLGSASTNGSASGGNGGGSASENAPVRTSVRNKIGNKKAAPKRRAQHGHTKAGHNIIDTSYNHLDLLYETRREKMFCWMCRAPGKDELQKAVASFSTKASWTDFISHYHAAHPNAMGGLEWLMPSQIAEVRQRMTSSKVPGSCSSS